MVQVQEFVVPIVDRNPQTFMEIPKAALPISRRRRERVYRSRALNSSVTLSVESGI